MCVGPFPRSQAIKLALTKEPMKMILQNISVRIVAVKLIYLVNNSQVTKKLIEPAVKIILTNQTETKGNINIIAQRQITVQCDVTHNCS